MATTSVTGRVLYTGQGMCNTIEVYDGTTLTYLALIDFGSEKDSTNVRTLTLPKLIQTVKNRGKIDLMIVSHSDRDHWKFIPELLDGLPTTVKIAQAVFGIGDWTKDKATTFRAQVVGRMETGKSVTIITAAKTSIADTVKAWIKVPDGPTFNLLAGSVVESDVVKGGSSVVETNTASLVIRCLYKGNYLVFLGDATRITLRYINDKMGGHSFSGTGFMMTAPHHGALATLGGTLEDLKTLTEAVEPECAVASAQFRVNFNHPNACVMATMCEYAGKNAYPKTGTHTCVVNFAETGLCTTNDIYKDLVKAKSTSHISEWYVLNTDLNLFTTISTTSSIVHWYFRMNTDGSTEVSTEVAATGIEAMFREMAAQPAFDAESFFVGDIPAAFRSATLEPTTASPRARAPRSPLPEG
ncbi:hypothetical protein MZO42_07100 [Sphingomonas psychrotolerans]|uniref:Metallo-beta-lactamase domain-containing protein n=1 Tax=Sphingomonas psychrotolerans TaxID=1327635 RepID=A0ABU3N1N7_9SPHN|nr:hypothetical protein [Sphingomonas psychrotolerans]MDT8758459.1 hypothetical protein [Sphingomonas psychrotolerans]